MKSRGKREKRPKKIKKRTKKNNQSWSLKRSKRRMNPI
jgi:hypothetical protein